MSTKAQIKANQQNAKKSTGPQTAEGKAVVSQNAVKHGLFAAEAVITGENPAEYERYHEQFLAELLPVGMVESMLAERVVSLAWRLQRAERMQNEVFEDMIERNVTNKSARHHRENYCRNQGIRPGDPRFDLDLLPLGRIAMSDWSNCSVLDRMMLYERRIENSQHKSLNRLKQYQVIRRVEKEDANQRQPAPESSHPAEKLDDLKKQNQNRPSAGNPKHETRNPKRVEMVHLKKQSQFAPELMGTTSFMQGAYGNNPAGGDEENKAKQSQFHTRAALEGDQSIHCSPKIQG